MIKNYKAVRVGQALMVTGLAAAALCTQSQAAPVVSGASLSGTQPVLVHSVLVFPTAADEGDTGEGFHVASKLDKAIQFRLNTIGHLKVTYFSKHLASIERAVDQDKSLTDAQVSPPFDDAGKAGPVATMIGTDAYLVDRVESYTYDDATKKATIEVSANLYNTETGDGIAGIAVTGSGVGISNSDEQLSITQYAINDAASQIVREVNDAASPVPTVTKHGSQIGGTGKGAPFLLAILVGAAMVAAFNHSSSHGSSGSSSSGSGSSGGSGGPGPIPVIP
jgi:hypothetical protein